MNEIALILFAIETLIAFIYIWSKPMGRDDGRFDLTKWIVAIVAVLGLFVTIYLYGLPYGFTIDAPITELHVCVVDGRYTFETPAPSSSPNSKTMISNIASNGDTTTFDLPISITDDSWRYPILGNYIKPYSNKVYLYIENSPPGLKTNLPETPFSAKIQENSHASYIPPFDTKISFRIASNVTLPYGTYDITINGIGSDKKEAICVITLKVGQLCDSSALWAGMPPGNFIENLTISYKQP